MRKGMKPLLHAALLALLACGAYAGPDGIVEDDEYAWSEEFGNGAFTLHWRIDGDTAFFAMQSRTTGWVALGIEPTEVMNQADMIFGWVDDAGNVTLVDAFSTGIFGPHPPDTELGGTDDIANGAGREENGITTIEFSRKLATGDRYDKNIVPETDQKIIWAFGSTDSFEDMHVRAGTATIGMSTGTVGSSGSRPILILVHAVFLTAGFMLMAAGIAIARYYRNKKWWMKVHKPIGVTAAVLSVVGIVIGYIMVDVTTGIHFRVLHTIFGAVTLFFILGAPILGSLIFSKSPNKQTIRVYHRWTGRTALVLMMTTILLGMNQAGLF